MSTIDKIYVSSFSSGYVKEENTLSVIVLKLNREFQVAGKSCVITHFTSHWGSVLNVSVNDYHRGTEQWAGNRLECSVLSFSHLEKVKDIDTEHKT